MNIFIVPSCIKSPIGKINHQDRFEQTLKTFETVRKQVENAIIIFCDSSVGGLEESQRKLLQEKTDYYLSFSEDPTAQEINSKGLKSIGESYLLRNGILFAQRELDLKQEGRMFKLGGRCELQDNFTINDYANTQGKYVFKKRLETWMDDNAKSRFGISHILETRLYSWSLDLTSEYLEILTKNFALMSQGLDTEHCHFLNIPKEKLLEFEKLNVGCFVAAGAYYIVD